MIVLLKKIGKLSSSHIVHLLRAKYCWIVWDSELIRLLETSRPLTKIQDNDDDSSAKYLAQNQLDDTNVDEVTQILCCMSNINTIFPWEFAKECILKPVELFPGHCLDIKRY